MERFRQDCPSCAGAMVVRNLSCTACGLKIEGDLRLPNLVRLSPDQREFIELFVVSGGSLKDIGQILGISYPTVRARLDSVISSLKILRGEQEAHRHSVLDRLEKGEINAKEASALLRANEQERKES